MPTIEEITKELKKKYGNKIRTAAEILPYPRVPTGSLAMDVALAGGIPQGLITTIAGFESVGKSAVAYNIMSQAQTLFPEKKVGWIAVEPLDLYWAEANGLDTANAVLIEPESAEEAIDVYVGLLESRFFSVLVMDSLGAMWPKKELEETSEKELNLARAKKIKTLMGKVNAKLQPTVKEDRNDCACIFLNHMYQKPDMYSPEEMAGGKAVRMFSSIIMKFRRMSMIHEKVKPDGKVDRDSPALGIEVGVRFEKNKVQGMQKEFFFDFYNQSGLNGYAKAGTFDNYEAAFRLGQEFPSPKEPFIKRSGAWFSWKEHKFQGEKQFKNFLFENPEVLAQLKSDILDSSLKRISASPESCSISEVDEEFIQ